MTYKKLIAIVVIVTVGLAISQAHWPSREKAKLKFNVSALEGSSSTSAGLYRTDTFGLASVSSEVSGRAVWVSDLEGAPICTGDACQEIRTSGKLGAWDQRISDPLSGAHLTPKGIQPFKWELHLPSSRVSNLRVLFARDISNYVALIRDERGNSRVAVIVNGTEKTSEGLGVGEFSWKTDFAQKAGCVSGERSERVICVLRQGTSWALESRHLQAPPVTVAVINETQLVVSEPGSVQLFDAGTSKPPSTLKSNMPVVSSAVVAKGGLVLVGHTASSAKGSATVLEYYRASSTEPAWSRRVAGDLTVTGTSSSSFLAAADGKRTWHILMPEGILEAQEDGALEFFGSDGQLARVTPGRAQGVLTLDRVTE